MGGSSGNRSLFSREKLWSLDEMEITGGEPGVAGRDKKTGECICMLARRKVLKTAEVFATINTVASHNGWQPQVYQSTVIPLIPSEFI